jgi:hypothetical protein
MAPDLPRGAGLIVAVPGVSFERKWPNVAAISATRLLAQMPATIFASEDCAIEGATPLMRLVLSSDLPLWSRRGNACYAMAWLVFHSTGVVIRAASKLAPEARVSRVREIVANALREEDTFAITPWSRRNGDSSESSGLGGRTTMRVRLLAGCDPTWCSESTPCRPDLAAGRQCAFNSFALDESRDAA